MWIEVGNTECKVRADEDEIAWLDAYLSFEDERARFKRSGDGKLRMFNAYKRSFPTGLLSMCRKAAAADGIVMDVFDTRKAPAEVEPDYDYSWLRDYQQDAVAVAIAKVRGLLWLPTGAGKTECAAALMSAVPCRWVFMVHKRDLLEQTRARFVKRTGEVAGAIGDGEMSPQRVTIVTFQTVAAALRSPKTARSKQVLAVIQQAQGLIADECHVVAADSFWKVMALAVNAYWRIGLSGTPLARGDKRSAYVMAQLGPVIYRLKPDVLIERGVLARPRIRFIPVSHKSVVAATWQGVYSECVTDSGLRNFVVAVTAAELPKPCLVFVKEIAHGRKVEAAIRRCGMRTEFVWGNAPTTTRLAAIKRLVRGETDVLVTSAIFNEGVDIPSLRSLVAAAGGASVIAAIQRVGRGMRVSEGKDSFEVRDIADRGNKWLVKHTKAREAAYIREGYDVSVDETAGSQLAVLYASGRTTQPAQPLLPL